MLRLSIIIVSIKLIAIPVLSQTLDVKITEGFKLGNASLIMPHLAGEVELILPEQSDVFSRDGATKQLESFFSGSKVNGFIVIHSGSSPGGAAYYIGTLSTAKGEFRVYLLLEKKEHKIVEIRVEQDE